jgi:hypothetical protein
MAITVTQRGTGTNNTANTNWNLSPTSNFSGGAGAWGVLCVAADNGSAGGSTNDLGNTLSDSLGNTWTKRQGPIFDNGAASAGVQGAIYTSDLSAGVPQTSTTITVTTGASATAKTWTLIEVNFAANKTGNFVTGANGTGSTTSTPSITTGSITSGNLVVAATFQEAGTTQGIGTDDTDTTNGSWASPSMYAEIGATTSGSVIASNYKVVNATGAQTYNLTMSLSVDQIMAWIEISEVNSFTPVDPMGMSGFFGL